MSLRLIWLSGWASSGKDTAAEILCRGGAKRLAFADSLKDMVAEKYGFPRHWCDSVEGKATVISEHGASVRELLIRDSFEAKKQDINIFARIVFEKILNEFVKGTKIIVISDWRYPHEYHFVTGATAGIEPITVRITRPGLEPLADDSEHQLDFWDFNQHIENTVLEEFQNRVAKILN
jgi:hypothetical protein